MRLFLSSMLLIIALNQNAFSVQITKSVSILSRGHFGADIKTFKFNKNKELWEKYFIESNFYVDAALVEYKYVSLCFMTDQKAGMGQSVEGLVFDPRDISFGLVPYFQITLPPLNIITGLDHRCFHEIDKKEEPSAYWNKVFIGIRSNNYYLSDFVSDIMMSDNFLILDKWSYAFTWGYYGRKFFGLIGEDKIMSATPLYVQDIDFSARYGLIHYKRSVLNLTGRTLIGISKDDNVTFSQEFGFEANFNLTSFGGSVFVNYILDKHRNWFDSKDKLLEIGLRLFK